ncbi:MAG: hypothetical protein RLZ98_3764 [Pseudomonadota bacterium]
MVKGVVIWAAVSTAAMLLAGVLAGWKNRDYSFWMAWGFVFPPSVLVLLVLPRHKGPRPTRPPADDLWHEDSAP